MSGTDGTIIVELPFPHPKLNPNQAHGGWRTTETLRASTKQIGYVQGRVALENQSFMPAEQYALRITFYPPDRRHRDADNLHASMKHYLDGVCQALNINDRSFREITLAFGEVRKPGAVTVEITELVKSGEAVEVIRQALEASQ